jgi:hypothetical protein
MLNLPPSPGPVGVVLLALGAGLGLVVLVGLRARLAGELGWRSGAVESWLVAAVVAVSVAGAPFTLWRVGVDIRETSRFSATHKRYVGAETKLVDGELAERVGALIPPGDTYFVAVAPDAHSEIRESLALWLGYAFVPRRRVRTEAEADWVVTWGATPAELDLATAPPTLVGRNRLVEREPVYVAAAEP